MTPFRAALLCVALANCGELSTPNAEGSSTSEEPTGPAASKPDEPALADASAMDADASTEARDAGSPEVGAIDTCAVNACGGCAALPHAPLAACGDGGVWLCSGVDGVACATAESPTNVRASTNSEDGVQIDWDPPSSAPTEYVVLRDGIALGIVGPNVRVLTDAFSEEGTLPTPVVSATTTRTDGVELSWTAGASIAGVTHEYSVVARYGLVDSAASPLAIGRRAAPTIAGYELSRDDGANWSPAASTSPYLDIGAPLAAITGGTINVKPEPWRTLVRLEVTSLPTVSTQSALFRMRAIGLSGLKGPPSLAVTGMRTAGRVAFQWERSAASTDVQYVALPGVTGALWVDAEAAFNETRYYRAVAHAAGAAPHVLGPTATTLRSLHGLVISAGLRSSGCGFYDDSTTGCWGLSDVPPSGVAFDKIAVYGEAACGIESSTKQVRCWGGMGAKPFGTEVALDLALVSGGGGCIVRTNHQLACVGWTTSDDPTSEFKAQSFARIWTPERSICGLRTDGTLTCHAAWTPELASVPSGVFVDVSAGSYHACALRQDGSFACWGSFQVAPNTIPANEKFVALRAGYSGTCGLRLDGSLACWGGIATDVPANGSYDELVYGALGCVLRKDQRIRCWGWDAPRLPILEPLRAVEVGGYSSCGLRDSDGTVLCWGLDLPPAPAGTFGALALGERHACSLSTNGKLACWGASPDADIPGALQGATFSAITAYSWGLDGGTCAVTDVGNATCFGKDPITPPSSGPFKQITTRPHAGPFALRTNGTVVNGFLPPAGPYVAISALANGEVGIQADGRLFHATGYMSGFLDTDLYTAVSASPKAFDVCAIRDDGALACWNEAPPMRKTTHWPLDRFRALSARAEHACAIREDGHVLCWGPNALGQARAP